MNSKYFDNGEDKIIPFSRVISDYRKSNPIRTGSDAHIAYLEGKIGALKDVQGRTNIKVRDSSTYLGVRALYGYVLMTQDFAEDSIKELQEEQK